MTLQSDTDPGRELLPVTEDMLLTEEEVERLLSEAPAPFELSQAVLRFEESLAQASAGGDSEIAATANQQAAMASVQIPVHQGWTATQSPGKKPAARDRRNPAARFIFVAVALLCVAGAGVWLATPPAARPAKKESAANIFAHANTLPAAAHGDGGGVMISDTFDYPHKSELMGQSGGVGWDGPWTAAKAIIAPASLAAGQAAPGGAGAHVSLRAAEQISLARLFAKSVVLPDPKKGGEWWASLLVSHTGGSTGDEGELWINFFSGANINAVIRLTLTEKGRVLQLLGTGNNKPVFIPAEPGVATRIVARVQAKPAAGGEFDFSMGVWLNPGKAEALANPDLPLSLKGAAMSGHPGFSLHKLLQKAPGTTRLDQLIIARTAAAVME